MWQNAQEAAAGRLRAAQLTSSRASVESGSNPRGIPVTDSTATRADRETLGFQAEVKQLLA
jgi:hypothetical protein